MPDYLKIAEDFLQSGRNARAIEFAEKAAIDGQGSSKAFEIMGIAYYRTKNIGKSIECFNRSIESNPGNANVLYNLGLAYLFSSEYEKATEYTNLALKLKPQNLDYLYQLAIIYKRTSKLSDFIKICATILELDANEQSTLSLRAGFYLNNAEYELALKDFKKLDLNKADKAMVYNNIGFCYSKLGDYGRAKINLQYALEFRPSMAYAHNNLGFAYYQERNYSKALEHINESLKIDSSNSYALKNRAIVYLALKKTDQAIQDLE